MGRSEAAVLDRQKTADERRQTSSLFTELAVAFDEISPSVTTETGGRDPRFSCSNGKLCDRRCFTTTTTLCSPEAQKRILALADIFLVWVWRIDRLFAGPRHIEVCV